MGCGVWASWHRCCRFPSWAAEGWLRFWGLGGKALCLSLGLREGEAGQEPLAACRACVVGVPCAWRAAFPRPRGHGGARGALTTNKSRGVSAVSVCLSAPGGDAAVPAAPGLALPRDLGGGCCGVLLGCRGGRTGSLEVRRACHGCQERLEGAKYKFIYLYPAPSVPGRGEWGAHPVLPDLSPGAISSPRARLPQEIRGWRGGGGTGTGRGEGKKGGKERGGPGPAGRGAAERRCQGLEEAARPGGTPGGGGAGGR